MLFLTILFSSWISYLDTFLVTICNIYNPKKEIEMWKSHATRIEKSSSSYGILEVVGIIDNEKLNC